MNPITQIHDDLLDRLPGIALEIDALSDASGRWFLDIRPGEDSCRVVVEG